MSNRPNDPDDDFRNLLDDDDDGFNDPDDMVFDNFDDDDNNLDDIDFGDDDEGFDDFNETTEPAERSGPSRTFIIIAAILIIILLLGFGVLAFTLLGPKGPSPFDQTSTAIALTNDAIANFMTETSVAGIDQGNQTATAQVQFDSATATAESFNATATIEAQNSFATQTIEAQDAFATQTQIAAGAVGTGTALAFEQQQSLTSTSAAETAIAGGGSAATETPSGGVNPNAIQETATALRASLLTQTQQAVEGGGAVVGTPSGGAIATPTPRPTTLEDAGFIDDLGSGGPGVLLLMGAALLGVILMSRGLRVVNNNR